MLDGFFISIQKIFNLDLCYLGPAQQVLISTLGQPIPQNGIVIRLPENIIGSDVLIGIIKTKNHWNLYVINWTHNILVTYDPYRPMENGLLHNIFDFISVLRYQKGLPTSELRHFDISTLPHAPRQNEDHPHSCGVYVACVGLFLALKSPLIMPEPISFYRQMIHNLILKGSLPYSIIHDHDYSK